MSPFIIRLRRLHRALAPIMMFPLVLTLLTGMAFQMAVATGRSNDYVWLLSLHRGHFGSMNLEMIYPILNGLGLLTLVITGLLMWLTTPRASR